GANGVCGHPIEVGQEFEQVYLADASVSPPAMPDGAGAGPMPWLAALVCNSAFDLALHDAYGNLLGMPTYRTYNANFMNADLAHYLRASGRSGVRFEGLYPEDFLEFPPPSTLAAWHLVGGKDPVEPDELTGDEPNDGEPVLLRDWIRRDG